MPSRARPWHGSASSTTRSTMRTATASWTCWSRVCGQSRTRRSPPPGVGDLLLERPLGAAELAAVAALEKRGFFAGRAHLAPGVVVSDGLPRDEGAVDVLHVPE